MGGHASEVDSAGGHFDEEQHIQPLQPHCIDGEEVTCHDSGSLLAQERPPGGGRRPRRRIQAMTAQRHTNRGGRDLHTKPVELALDTLVAPAWVLPGQTDDQLLDLLIQWRSSRSTRLGPGAGDQPPMPTQ